jgi:penicillin G amidase
LRNPVALRWVALDAADCSVEAMLRVNYAENWQQFNAALQTYVTPTLNFVYADRAGNIGYIGAGHIPVRSRGTGSAPVPGWDPAYRWESYIPYDELPRIFNPPSGYIVSANNDPTPPGYRHFISQEWAPVSRARRIEALLEDRIQKHTAISVMDIQAMQADLVSLPATRLRDRLLVMAAPDGPRQREAMELLANWHGEMTLTSQAASLLNIWADHIRHKLFEARLEPRWTQREQTTFFDSLIEGLSIEDLTRVLDDPHNPWCITGKGSEVPDCRVLVDEALEETLTELRRLAGDNSRNWSWGRLHRAVFRHAPFSDTRILDRIFERRTQTGGSPDTINVANATYRRGDAYLQTFGAGFRQIMEPGKDRVAHWVMNSTGQSGNVFSPHYDDMIEPFRRAELVPIARPTAYSICLVPQDHPIDRVSCASALPKAPRP